MLPCVIESLRHHLKGSRRHMCVTSRVSVCLLLFSLLSLSQSSVPATIQGTAPNRASDSTGVILYTGELDGLLGSWAGVDPPLSDDDWTALVDANAGYLLEHKHSSSAILLGMGDNFAPDLPSNQYDPRNIVALRLSPHPMNRVIRFMNQAGYDAVVPGKEDFAFGIEFLRAIAEQNSVPLIANNLTVQSKPSNECLSYPPPTPSLPLLTNQVSTPVSSPSSASGSGAAGSGGGGGGGGKGKGGHGGAGGGAAPGAAPGAGTAGSNNGNSCPLSGSPQSSGTQPSPSPSKLRPALVWPSADAVYPWTASLAISVSNAKVPLGNDAWMCPYSPDVSKVDEIVPENCVKWPRTPAEPSSEETSIQENTFQTKLYSFSLVDVSSLPFKADGIIPQDQPAGPTGKLYPGNVLKFCVEEQQPLTQGRMSKAEYVCTLLPIMVRRTLLRRAWISASDNYVVFGVLAPDTLNGLPDIDRQWATDKLHPQMQVTVSDPASPLIQAMNAYDLLNPTKTARAIVLAQMTPAESKALADTLGARPFTRQRLRRTQVSLILSAADSVEATPDLIVRVPTPQTTTSQVATSQGNFIPVITPSPIFQKAKCLSESPDQIESCVARLEYTQNYGSLINVAATSYSQAIQPQASTDKTFCDNQIRKTWECDVLDKMRITLNDTHRKWHADLAILEQKNFDYARSNIRPDLPASGTLLPGPSPDQMVRALWNAGNLTRVTLLGSTLMSILSQNQANQAQNFETSPSIRQSEQLRILGIFQDRDTYYIRGIPLDATKLYAVATSDNLATTNSDYAALASQDQNLPEVFWQDGKTESIVDIAVLLTQPLLAESDLEGNYNPAQMGSVTPTDVWQALPKVAPLALTHSNRVLFASPSPVDLRRLAQLEPVWHDTVQQLSIGFSNARPSQSDQSIGANLGGVTNPNVVSPHSDTFSVVSDSRLEYYLRRGHCDFCLADLGADEQINFTRSRQGSTTPAQPATSTDGTPVSTTSVSYPANTYMWSPFVELQTNKLDYWKPIVLRPGVLTANVAAQRQYLTSGTAGIDFLLEEKRAITFGGGVGTRFEQDDFNYVEFGYNYQMSYHILSDIMVPGQPPCFLNSKTTISMCAMKLPGTIGVPLEASYSNYGQNGGYFLGTWTQPFPLHPFGKVQPIYPFNPIRKVLFLNQMTAFGNFFAYGNASSSSALTRYAFALNDTLQISLPANFTFGPSYNWFFFQANGHFPGASLHRSSLSAQLSYSFDWHSGLSLSKAAAGKIQ
jgi:hypothetical protein